jgi:hypothetical protein
MKRNLRRRTTLIELRLKSVLTAFLCMLLACGSVVAQVGTSSVGGTVVDPEGKAVAGATVKLTNAQKGFSRTQTTSESGAYSFPAVPPDTYTVEAEATGFKKAVISDVRALVDKQTTLEVSLALGSINEAVTVSAASNEVLINTQDASIGNNFQASQITQLPLESRNILQLLSLQPGVTRDGYVTGSRADQANITLDGVDVNEQQGASAFESVLRVSTETIEEFRVITSNPNATQGRSSGAQVSLITKSGTNEFRGSAFWSHRNTVTTANDFFNNRSIDLDTGLGVPRPKLLRNVYGGTFGGPIKKEKLFFFYGFEGRRDASEEPVTQVVPLASLGRGEVRFRDLDNQVVTLRASDINALFPAGVNPAALAVLADAARRYPANSTTDGDGLNTGAFRFNAPIAVNLQTHTLKLDYNWKANHAFFIRGNYQRDIVGGTPQFPDTARPATWNHPLGVAAGHTWTVSNNIVNTFRYGLTREAFTTEGDSAANATTFRFVFSPLAFSRTLSRVTPVHNFIDDISYVKNNHSMQFGTNIRLVKNSRTTFANSFDFATANPSFYDESGFVLSDPIDAEFGIGEGQTAGVQAAVSAIIGRFSQYNANFNFDRDGSILPVGAGVPRTFATQEYDFYAQDSWKLRPNLTLTYGLRYGVSRPVYETTGLQVKPTTSLGGYFERRKSEALLGRAFNDPITVDLAGPKNDRPGYYDWDKNNLQPRFAFAWSPSFKSGFLSKLFGAEGDSVFRGGFAMTNDAFGQQLAVQFDLNSTLGFSSSQVISANTFNVSDRLAPRFTNVGQDVRSLPLISVPGSLTFPLVTPADEAQRIESSLDDTIVTPTNYSWNFSYGRKLPGSIFVEAAYVGRAGRDLLATRDVMALNNIVDPKSGLDWYTAAGKLADLRLANTPITAVQPIDYFQNLFPNYRNTVGGVLLTPTQRIYRLVAREEVGGFNILDWTFIQLIIDDVGIAPNLFFHPQYAALSTFSTVADSDYHAGTLSIRQRYKESLTWDFNYTYSRSIDNASGLQTSGAFGAAFILNPLRPEDNRAASDFDITHIVNANSVYQLPFGKGRSFLSDANSVVDGIIGGWQLTSIFRWNSGQFVPGSPFDQAQWATNWNVQSNGTRTAPIETSPTRGGGVGNPNPNLFQDALAAYRTFRNARPGETGDRNVLRNPGYIALDMGLGKSFNMPWEGHKLQFRWEVFNVTNTQRLQLAAITRANFGLDIDPHLGTPADVWGNLDSIQGSPRVMQFGLRYSF